MHRFLGYQSKKRMLCGGRENTESKRWKHGIKEEKNICRKVKNEREGDK